MRLIVMMFAWGLGGCASEQGDTGGAALLGDEKSAASDDGGVVSPLGEGSLACGQTQVAAHTNSTGQKETCKFDVSNTCGAGSAVIVHHPNGDTRTDIKETPNGNTIGIDFNVLPGGTVDVVCCASSSNGKCTYKETACTPAAAELL